MSTYFVLKRARERETFLLFCRNAIGKSYSLIILAPFNSKTKMNVVELNENVNYVAILRK